MFLLYLVSRQAKHHKFTRVGEVKLGGRHGPIAKVAMRAIESVRAPCAWHATSEQLVGLLAGRSEDHQIIIDLKPKDDRLSLYRITDVWGYSHDVYSPVALGLEALFSDFPCPDPDAFKRAFTDRDARRSRLATFLYLQGGIDGGSWNWGKVGFTNGALLWAEAFSYFSSQLADRVTAREKERW